MTNIPPRRAASSPLEPPDASLSVLGGQGRSDAELADTGWWMCVLCGAALAVLVGVAMWAWV